MRYFKDRDRWSFSSQKNKKQKTKQSKNDKMIFSLAWNTMFGGYWKVLGLNFFVDGNTFFLSLKVDENIIFTDYWKVIVLSLEKVLVSTLRRWKIPPFLSEKIHGKMIFTWSFSIFQDIPGLGKYSSSCNDICSLSVIRFWK